MGLELICPCCGNRSFEEFEKGVKCNGCGNAYSKETLEIYSEEKGKKTFDLNLKSLGKYLEENADFTLYSCPACMGEFVSPENESRVKCIYCGRDMLSERRVSKALRADGIIPFGVKREQASRSLKKFCENKPLLPKSLVQTDFYEEIKGIFVPVWVLDGKGSFSTSFKGEKSTHTKKGKAESLKTDFYLLKRAGNLFLENFILKDEKAFYNDFLEDIEPFYFSEAADTKSDYLEGAYLAKPFESREEACDKICRAAKKVLISESKKDLADFSRVEKENSKIIFNEENLKYIFVPMWILNFNYDGKTYTFAVNGQTGKVGGNLPVGKGEYLKYFLLWFGVIAAAGIIIGNLL